MFAWAWDIKQKPKNIGETGIWVTGTRLFYVYIQKHRLFAASEMKRTVISNENIFKIYNTIYYVAKITRKIMKF